MDDGGHKEDKNIKMGAISNVNTARVVVLQEKKKTLEEALAKHNLELRQLCIKEAELTGIMPTEYPLMPGEAQPAIPKRIGASFKLPQSLINNINNEEESIQSLELEIQVLANMSEAALGLANEPNVNKTVRRTHMAEYQHLIQKYNAMQEKLQFLKTRIQMAQQPKQPSPNINQPKQKKKPRPLEIDDTVSMNEQFFKTPLRHSLRSLQHPTMQSDNTDHRYSVQSHIKLAYRGSDSTSLNENVPYYNNRTPPQEDPLISSFYRLSLNGYKNYVDRQESPVPADQVPYVHSQSSVSLYKQQLHYQYSSPSQTLPHPHALRRSPQPLPPQPYINHQTQSMQDFTKYNNNPPNTLTNLHRQISPSTSSNSSVKYYPSHTTGQLNYRPSSEHTFRTLNPHQLQPHQQYEQNVMTSGLGGNWKRSENGEMFWCNSASSDQNTLQKDKRFGSLDRRKNKRIQKRISPNVDPKSATLATVRSYNDPSRTLPSKAQQVVNRHRQNNRQLVRTQSLGSVGGQAVDSVWPSDDNSSCGSESLCYSEHNKQLRTRKQKEWYETSLDGPPIPETPSVSRSHSTVPSIAPEEKYMDYPSPLLSPQSQHSQHSPHTPNQIQLPSHTPKHSPQTPKPMLEIPAESNPSPRAQETNLEIFNNNIPRNGTVVQPAQWKPYHEETKPFEMADFYKYSTKFKKSPVKSLQEDNIRNRSQSIGFRNLHSPQGSAQQNLNDNYEDDNASVSQKSTYQPLQPMKCKPFNSTNSNIPRSSPNSLNTSLELSSNVAENFSAEMNAWYQNHEHQTDNNNATLV